MKTKNLAAEKAALGAFLLDNETFQPELRPDHFSHPVHQWLYEVMLETRERGEVVDLVSMGEAVWGSEKLKAVGGSAYIAALTSAVESKEHAERYAKKVMECHRRRTIKAAALRLAEEMEHEEIDEALGAFTRCAHSSDTTGGEARRASEYALEALNDLEAQMAGTKTLPTIPSGFQDVDSRFAASAGDVVVIAGRPGMGKTAVGLNVATNVAGAGRPAMFLTAEMPARQIINRAISSLGGISATKLRDGRITPDDFAPISKGVGKLSDMDLYIFDSGTMTAEMACAAIVKARRKYGIEVAILDHIHQLAGKGERIQVIGEAIRMLKRTARDHEILIYVLAQLNRGVESRMPPIPRKSDLKESGTLEEVADSIILLYRQDYYAEDGLFDSKEGKKHFRPELQGVGLLIGDKARNGPTWKAELGWHGPTTSYRSLV